MECHGWTRLPDRLGEVAVLVQAHAFRFFPESRHWSLACIRDYFGSDHPETRYGLLDLCRSLDLVRFDSLSASAYAGLLQEEMNADRLRVYVLPGAEWSALEDDVRRKTDAWRKAAAAVSTAVGGAASASGASASASLAMVATPAPASEPAVVTSAKSWQGKGKYPGVDSYTATRLKKGDIVYGGTPGQSEYYLTPDTYHQCGNDATRINRALQVGPYKGTYRPTLTKYRVVEECDAAIGVAAANRQFGPGGGVQVYIPDFRRCLVAEENIPLINTTAPADPSA